MTETNDTKKSSMPIQATIMDTNKKIPELMIPSFETSKTEDSDSVSIGTHIISPDNLSGISQKTMNSDDVVDISLAKSPNSSNESQIVNESCASSPTNPSAPLTSPSRVDKPPISKDTKDNSTSHAPQSSTTALKSDGSDNALSNVNYPPLPLSQRGRVVSLDRGRYMNNLNGKGYYDGDDDLSSSSSIGSSDGEGSYFSEHLPSPPRRRESIGSHNPRLLPPGAAKKNSRSNRNIQMPMLQSQDKQFTKSHESDLSLSSSSCDEDYDTSNLAQTYSLNRAQSAPVSQRSTLKTLFTNDHRDTLDLINAPLDDHSDLPLPKNVQRFPSTSSLVSSSSEDVERKQPSIGKHRRQNSYRSIGSITSAGSAYLPEKPKRLSSTEDDIDNESSKPPEMVSFHGSKNTKSSNMKRSTHEYYPHLPRNNSYNNSKRNQPLSDDQMNAWRSGLARAESYVSSSNGNNSGHEISPERTSKESTSMMSSNSKHSSSRNGSGIFVYSEDDTDESIRYMEARKNISNTIGNDVSSASGSFKDDRRTNLSNNRSFGKDLTNADGVEPSRMNTQTYPNPNSRNYRSEHNGVMFPHDSSFYSDNFSVGSSKYFKVYWKRWLMLMYMSLLNLLSDWTCFSVAPIALLTTEAFQDVNPEHLVTIFLFANTFSTATEPILLSRLGLRKTVVFGSFLLMIGNIVKSGGIPGIIGDGLQGDNNTWRLYAGFFLVGLSQPLYQCTPSILSSSWFPEKERTLATGIALNSNQLGIGCSFVLGSLLVVTHDDIPSYFALLSLLSTIVFIGCYLQFQDAPPTPPSETARVMRGNSMLPYFNIQQSIPQYFRRFQGVSGYENMTSHERDQMAHNRHQSGSSESRSSRNRENESNVFESRTSRRSKRSDRKERQSPSETLKYISRSRSRRESSESNSRNIRRSHGSRTNKSDLSSKSRRSEVAHNLLPSPTFGNVSTEDAVSNINMLENEAVGYGTVCPSPMMQGRVRQSERESDQYYLDTPQRNPEYNQHVPYGSGSETPGGRYHPHPLHNDPVDLNPETPFPNLRYSQAPSTSGFYSSQISQRDHHMQYYYHPMADPRLLYNNQAAIPPEYYHYQNQMHPSYHRYSLPPNYPQANNYFIPFTHIPSKDDGPDEGVEPILMHAGSYLSIDIRDDQIIRSIKACFSRPGFLHTVIAFAVSGVVLNTISTYTDSLLSLGGAGRGTVGFIGGFFQILVMASSMIIGRITDKKRAYYCVVIGLLVMGAFTLAECAINLEAERGSSLGSSMLILAIFVGPLQPVATELGVEV